ncbi:MAG TPA: alpha-L-fucosidase, partial [Gemmatimonadales bacterium]|nr:alpha-L-fucosidase [Gemmatimonadales bacterium]
MTSLSRREFLAATSAALLVPRVPQPARPVPSRAQLEWQRDELALFLHFGVNTFTDQEWGTGREDPQLFAPAKLDARQWARAAKASGFRSMILTAKHHDGFCLWPSRTTPHSVAGSAWREGKGDVVREFTDACHAEGLKAGLYLSPWDRNNPAYGDSPRYNDLYCDQLTELLSDYGSIHEVWFDGANGEGPNGKRQVYDWPRFWGLVRRLQPKAVMFSDAGPDIRWIGNERGSAGETNWSTMDPAAVPYPGASSAAIIRALQQGDPSGTVWRPGETDVSIRPGWFYHPAEDARVKSADELVELYLTSVGRNSKLLLNVPPTRDGLLHEIDSARLAELHERLAALFARDLLRRDASWRMTGARSAVEETELGSLVSVGLADLREDIEQGQLIARYVLEGSDGGPWQTLSRGSTIGYRKLDRFEPVAVRR